MNKFVEGRPRGSLAVGDDESGSDVCSVHRLLVIRRSFTDMSKKTEARLRHLKASSRATYGSTIRPSPQLAATLGNRDCISSAPTDF